MSILHGGMSSRSELEASLVKKWKDIEALDDEEDGVSDQEFNRYKEAWFGPAFTFLQDLPLEEHCWCGHSEIAWPLLEPFHFYHSISEKNFAVKILWKRFSQELRKCTRCVLQYHKAKEIYATEFLESAVKDLLEILQTLDEERVATHLKEILCKMRSNSLEDSEEIICVLFEVMRFPSLLDDAEIDTAFIEFLRYVENTYDLTLAADQCYAGVYALFFHNDQATRRVALRLAGTFGKLRTAADLEPIQPLLQKHMHCLEFDLFDQRKVASGKCSSALSSKSAQESTSSSNANRPRAYCTRESLWMGLKTLLGMLEPPAFEEGVVERYPVFLSIVLNHASEATPVFWNALHCLKLLLEVLGYKLWIKTTFSPGVMRSTLIGQCFHTREEKMHKAIFDLFQPFLQSLEALQDGEYERQRRNILYFLLQQVGHSRNFSGLMSKKARQIAYLIVMRGFKMEPACPPMECVHMWGPSLLESVRDRQLYDSLRQPAVQLLEMIIIADSVVLTCLHKGDNENKSSYSYNMLEVAEENIDDSCGMPETGGESSYLREFKALDKLADHWNDWVCAPILWVEILAKDLPSDLPDSFSQAVMWASSRLCTVYCKDQVVSRAVQPGDFLEVVSSNSLASSLIWEIPKGCDDGADGQLCSNSLKVSCHGSLLVSLLKRCVGTFIGHIQPRRVSESWIWDPYLAEVLVLLSLDSYDKIKDFGRFVLSHFAKDSSLDVGLKFLNSSQVSAACVISGLFYATKLLIMDRLHETVSCLENLLFFAWKLINLWQRVCVDSIQSPSSIDNLASTGKEGGFLKQPNYDQPSQSENADASNKSSLEKSKNLQNLQHLSSSLWPLLLKIMKDGRPYSEDSAYKMIFARTFDLLPLVFSNIFWSLAKTKSTKSFLQSGPGDFEELHAGSKTAWILYLMSWGEVCIVSIHRRWRTAVDSILIHLKNTHCVKDPNLLKEVQDWLEAGTPLSVQIRDKLEPLLHLAISGASKDLTFSHLKNEASSTLVIPQRDTKDVLNIDRGVSMASLKEDVIVLSDDDTEHLSTDSIMHIPTLDGTLENMRTTEKAAGVKSSEKFSSLPERIVPSSPPRKHMHPLSMQKQLGVFQSGHGKMATLDKFFGSLKDRPLEKSQIETKPVANVEYTDALECSDKVSLPKDNMGFVGSEERVMMRKGSESVQKSFEESSKSSMAKKKNLEETQKDCLDAVLKELVQDEPKDLFKAVKPLHVAPKKGLSLVSNPQPKRQLIQLGVPNEHLRGNAKKIGLAARVPVPKLDEWFKRILSLDYFSVIGLSSESNAEGIQAEPMLKVPVTFRSSQHYMDVFRPLVLEEFRAQLQQSYDQLNLSDETTTGVLRLMSLEKVDDFDIGRFIAEAGADGPARACFENDLLLLSRQPLQTGAQAVHIIGKVERQERDNKSHSVKLVLRFYLRSSNKRLVKARSLLLERSKWHATRLMSITPQVREFQALSAVEYFPLLPIILNDGSCKMGTLSSKQILQGLSDKLHNKLKADYNPNQLQAIDIALRSAVMANGHELSLVQGPPGTGKTRTILAIVSALTAPIKNLNGCTESGKLGNSLGALHSNRPVSKSVAIARSWQAAALAKEQIQQESENMQRERERRKRILVCAQSNAAVDELVSRMCKDGLYDSDGSFFQPNLVRVGNAKNVHPKCLHVFIDTLVKIQMESEKENYHTGGSSVVKNTPEVLRSKLDKVLDSIQGLEAQLSKLQNNDARARKGITQDTTGTADLEGTTKMEVNLLYKQRRQICAELAAVEALEKRSVDEERKERLRVKREIIRRAEVVVATLSGCGGDVYSACVDQSSRRRQIRNLEDGLFDAVVIDEAAQALEPATLIPLQLLKASRAKCIMVGDPKQLPATVISQMASRFSFECSLFERLQKGGHPVSLLNVQYRMHPEICEFPSAHFYENQLKDGNAMLDGRKAVFHEHKYTGPYAVFDVVEGYEKVRHQSTSQSLCNEAEVDVALEIFRNLMTRYPGEVSPGRIGIITPYQQQLSLLRDRFYRVLGQSVAAGVEFNTVDGFQGREVDIIIFSTVRATSRDTLRSSRIGFVADVRRMNVALTRARFSLWIVCNAATLQNSPPWAALLENAMDRGVLHTVKSPYRGFFDKCPADKLREQAGYMPRRSSPVTPQSMLHIDLPVGKKGRGNDFSAQNSNSVYRSPKNSDHVEKSSNKFVTVKSFRENRDDSKKSSVFEGDVRNHRHQNNYREFRVDDPHAKRIQHNEKSSIDNGQHSTDQNTVRGKYEGRQDMVKSVSSDQRTHRQNKDNTVLSKRSEPDCRESGGVLESHGPRESRLSGKKKTAVGSQSPRKGLEGHAAGTTDTQIHSKEAEKQKRSAELDSMLKDTASRGPSTPKSKDGSRILDRAQLEMTANQGAKFSNLEASCPSSSNLRCKGLSTVQRVSGEEIVTPSEVKSKRLSTGQGVAGNDIISNSAEVNSRTNDAESILEMIRPLKRPRLEKIAGSVLPSGLQDSQLKSPTCMQQEDAVKDQNEHHASSSNEDVLNKEWDRFLEVLSESKTRFPLSKAK